MADYLSMSKEALQAEQQELQKSYDAYCAKGLKLDMSRGKPCPQQLDLSMDLLKIQQTTAENGMDLRNYGCLEGIPEARRLFAELLGTSEELLASCSVYQEIYGTQFEREAAHA